MVHWMRQRKPCYKFKTAMLETERPSPSYVADVSSPNLEISWRSLIINRCFPRSHDLPTRPIQYP